ncbi:type II toxin-antitoxin system RelE family toxin [Runella slithyformis]|uniref:Type II toxin-antitoxin system RelE/ParE family toxin n=1 Tax=Runella slithyformis (strain ATCC 29530 / DSM 19594 / LMG 11500 / NCIMB 11436 / LSU 4) TaxID=761193 RepID=A0A7U3ZHK0_RUNSL|nr:type II toxin-antitoxin system RelE/ParE family toxin [Runella slithyformis]AEI47342.1 hypothetical protein Runsl_0905 [Runella slithyformis DSM 19594]
MSYKISLSEKFQKEAKRLAKKYSSLKIDLLQLIETLEEDPVQGDALGNSCYKVRLRISSKGKGKSGGARVITHVHIAHENVYLLTIYDKSRKEDLDRGELESLLKMIRQ